MQQEKFTRSRDKYVDRAMSLPEFMNGIWENKAAIVAVTLVVIFIGVSFAAFTAKYSSQGFLQFGGAIPVVITKIKESEKEKEKEKEPSPGIALPDYKRYSAAFSTTERFRDYVSEKKLESDQGVKELIKTFTSRDGLGRVIEPVYPFTKFDAKELMEQPKDTSNNVIGLRIAFEGETPEVAQRTVRLLGNYVMDTIARVNYADTLRFREEELKTKMVKLDNIIIYNRTQLEELRRRAVELRQIIARNPSIAEQGGRQVVTINEENARYLPPTTQLATTEVRASEANEAILKTKRDQEQNALLLEYYANAKKLLDSTESGEKILLELDNVKEAVFKTKNLENDVVKEIYNQITVENQTARNVYLEKSRFIAGPTYPIRSNVRWLLLLSFFTVVGIFIGLVYVFGRRAIRNS